MKRAFLTILLASLSFLAFGAGEGLYYYRVDSPCKAVPIFSENGRIQFEEGDWFATPDFLGMDAEKDYPYPPVEMNGTWYGLGPFYHIITDKQIAAIKAGSKTVVNNPEGLLRSLSEHPRRTDYVRTQEMQDRADKVLADYDKMQAKQAHGSKHRKSNGEKGTFWIALLCLIPALLPVLAIFILSLNYEAEDEKKKEYKDRSKLPWWGLLMLLVQAGVFVGYYFILKPIMTVPGNDSIASPGGGDSGWIWAVIVAAIIFIILFCSGVMRFHREMYASWDLKAKPVIVSGVLSLMFLSTTATIAAYLGISALFKLIGAEAIGDPLGVLVGVILFFLVPLLFMRGAIIKQNPAAKPMAFLLIMFDLLAITVGVVIAMLALAGYIIKVVIDIFTGTGAGVSGIGAKDLLGGDRHCDSCIHFRTANCPYKDDVDSGTLAKSCYQR